MNPPEAKRFSTRLGGQELTIETGKYAKQVSGSIMVRYGETLILVTAQMSPNKSFMDFMPLTVEYEERHYAIGKIPGSFQRREGRPSIQATLNARLTDRQIRPLFPKGLRNEIQVIITVLSIDQQTDPAPLAAIGVSAALSMSDIPWDGPTACANVGYLDGNYVLNPSREQLELSSLELTVAASKDAVLMVEAAANELSEDIMVGAIEFAHQELQPVIAIIEQLKAELGQEKQVVETVSEVNSDDVTVMLEQARAAGLKDALLTQGKHARGEAIKAIRNGIIDGLVDPEAEAAAERISELKAAFQKAMQQEMRRMVIEENTRTDGRQPEHIRDIWAEVGVLPTAHGSAVFTRGETQVLGVATLGTGRDNRLVDDLGVETQENFMLHYNFPPYSTGEAKRLRGVSRRELGHGNLAKRALLPMIPSKDDFPYVLRVVGETLESNGSSSMATVCSASLSLMDAGVPLSKPVAGIAMGLVKENESYKILSDILGAEDALGDMDFKVTGTSDGVTALQMDIKIKGITPAIMREALDQAKAGRLHILGIMNEVLGKARDEVSDKAPRILTVTIPTDKIGAIIGPGGKNIRELEAIGGTVEIAEDGKVSIYSEDSQAALEIQARIKDMTATVEVGQTYHGTVTSIKPFGAFITLIPGTDGLLHISQIAEERVENVEDHLKVGDVIDVKVNGVDNRGKFDLIRPELEGLIPARAPRRDRPRRDNDRGDRNRR